MALLGLQFVITLVIALFLQKLSPYYSLARWIMCSRLYRCLRPTNEQLKSLAGKPSAKPHIKGKRRKDNGSQIENQKLETFTVPCNIDVALEFVAIEEVDLFTQYKYHDYKWLVDFSVCAGLAYIVIEVFSIWRPQIYTEEFNIGFVWCLLVAFFAIKDLVLLTAAYWGTEDGGEKAMSISFGFFFFVLAMGILIVDESILDFGLDDGYMDFSNNLEIIYKKLDFSIKEAPSIWTFKILLAVFSAFLGAIVGFPGIRYANMHLDSVYYYQDSVIYQSVSHIMFFSPVFLLLFWIPSVSKDLLYVRREKGRIEPLVSDETFVFIRIHVVIVFCILRLLVTPKLLQSHLNSACQKVAKLKKETGRILNLEIQRTVARVFYYLSAAALQYVAPLILTLALGLIVRTLTYNMVEPIPASHIVITGKALAEQKNEYAKLLRSLFSVKLVKGVASYLTWWTLVSHFINSCFGSVYLKFLA